MEVAVSFLKTDNYKKCIKKINESNADYIHVDVMDGKYTDKQNFTLKELIDTLKCATKPLNVHLMVNNPLKYIDSLAMFDVHDIIIHIDIKDSLKIINYIKDIGINAGIAINPDQDIKLLDEYLDIVDNIMIMSVPPGRGGLSFMKDISLEKLSKLNELKDKYHFITSIDGGINDEVIDIIKDQNLDIIVSGSFITDSDDYDEKINILKTY